MMLPQTFDLSYRQGFFLIFLVHIYLYLYIYIPSHCFSELGSVRLVIRSISSTAKFFSR